MRGTRSGLKQIETMLREIREAETFVQHGPGVADRVYNVVQKYPLAELHAFVRGMIHGL